MYLQMPSSQCFTISKHESCSYNSSTCWESFTSFKLYLKCEGRLVIPKTITLMFASLSTDLSNTQVCLLLQQLPQLNGN